MICKDITLSSPEENILFDEVLLGLAEKGLAGEVLRFWESPSYFIVLGKISKFEEDVNSVALREIPILVLRRSSGGGTVLQGQGCLNYTLILDKRLDKELNSISNSYQYILSRVIKGLNTLNVEAIFKPVSDIALADSEKKFSGNAQHRGKDFILHHGTILYDFDISQIEKYLLIPTKMPDYRHKRSHRDFVTNILASARDIKKAIRKVFDAQEAADKLSAAEIDALEHFNQTKQSTLQVFFP